MAAKSRVRGPNVHRIGHDHIVVANTKYCAVAKLFPARTVKITTRSTVAPGTFPTKPIIIPARWWIQGPGQGMRLLLRIDGDTGAVWPLGNSYAPGYVCWGGNRAPLTLDDADNVFWSSPFARAYAAAGATWTTIARAGGLEKWLATYGDKHDLIADMKSIIRTAGEGTRII